MGTIAIDFWTTKIDTFGSLKLESRIISDTAARALRPFRAKMASR
jgi:hypothetical protein